MLEHTQAQVPLLLEAPGRCETIGRRTSRLRYGSRRCRPPHLGNRSAHGSGGFSQAGWGDARVFNSSTAFARAARLLVRRHGHARSPRPSRRRLRVDPGRGAAPRCSPRPRVAPCYPARPGCPVRLRRARRRWGSAAVSPDVENVAAAADPVDACLGPEAGHAGHAAHVPGDLVWRRGRGSRPPSTTRCASSIKWMWLSVKPGRRRRPARSTTSVAAGRRSSREVCLSPAARMRPSRTATTPPSTARGGRRCSPAAGKSRSAWSDRSILAEG